MKKSLRYGIIALVIVGLGLVVGPWTYINLIKDDAPSALTIDDNSDATIPSGSIEQDIISDLNGEWVVTSGDESVVGYRVKEVLFGQSTEGVGRTREIQGQLTVTNDQVTNVSFTVQMGTLTSDAANRDRQFNGRIMDTSSYPTSTFVLTQPIALPANALSGEVITVNAQGDLTLRGTIRPVQFPLQAKVEGATFTVVGLMAGGVGVLNVMLPKLSIMPCWIKREYWSQSTDMPSNVRHLATIENIEATAE
jgi:polyisoprenoid-binding protein YceI